MPQPLRFHLDESVTGKIADGLRRRGIDCTSTAEQRLIGAADDTQLDFATSQSRILITADVDFLAIAATRFDHCGIVYWQKHRHFGHLIRELHRMSFAMSLHDFHGQVFYLA